VGRRKIFADHRRWPCVSSIWRELKTPRWFSGKPVFLSRKRSPTRGQPWTGRAAARGLDPRVALAPGLTAHTDPTLLAVILGNLCGNAVEHAPAGTPIHVRGNRTPDGVHLVFQNQAGELTEADVPHLFERFCRKDDVRSDGQHHGLGLALAAEFVAVLGGTLSARLAASKDLEFSLWLPT
jgi:signal transduction histidine kinase